MFGNKVFNINTIKLGTNRSLFTAGKIEVLGGLQATLNIPPSSLKNLYGNLPMAGEVYLQIRPRLN